MSFCLYELAKNAEIQRKVHEEIDRITEKYNGQLTYDAVNDMKYLETCIDGKICKNTNENSSIALISSKIIQRPFASTQ